MKILHVIATFPPAYAFGGPPKVVFNVCKELVKRGHEVEAYSTNAYDQRLDFHPSYITVNVEGIKVTYFPNLIRVGNLFISPKMIFQIKETIKSFDVLHIHFGRQLYDACIPLFNKKHIPLIFQAHGCLPYIGEKKIFKILYDIIIGRKSLLNSTKVVALTQMEVEQYRRIGVPDEKITIIPNGIDLAEYTDLPPKGCFKRKFGIPEEKEIILYLGRINKIKGIDILIKAYAHLTRKMGVKDTVLVIAGPDDGYLKQANKLTQSLGLIGSIIFTGPLYGVDKLKAYVDSNIYVLPSRYETFPMSVLESYACGKPVIASNIGGLRDLVINTGTGLLFEAGNSEDLAKSIHYLLNDYSKAEEMGHKGRKLVEEHFTINTVIKKLEHVYEDCLKSYLVTES